jgi:hypothetical protein
VFRPVACIDVPSDRNDRRNAGEPVENVWATDIAGVDDLRHTSEPLLNLRPQEAVSIRDDSNPEHRASGPVAVRRPN